jgi:hypothetical protein
MYFFLYPTLTEWQWGSPVSASHSVHESRMRNHSSTQQRLAETDEPYRSTVFRQAMKSENQRTLGVSPTRRGSVLFSLLLTEKFLEPTHLMPTGERLK